MLTKLVIKNFKKLSDVEIQLGENVVFIGPNNSGKTTALQALALWDVGMRAWNARREGKQSPGKRPGVTLNRRDLIAIPTPITNMLWNGLHIRTAKQNSEERGTQNIRIDVSLSGITQDAEWNCGLEFDCSNEESFVCRPLRKPGYENVPVAQVKFTEIPNEATRIKFAFLPPMSGLTAEEPLLQSGRINVLMGQGQTAQVLRNLCYQITHDDSNSWQKVVGHIESLFGVRLQTPVFLAERGEITMQYEERNIKLDISASGRGLQQVLLLLTHLYANPGSVLLLDEPDAHLEILRQREVFRLVSETARAQGSQVITASHSEVILNEAAEKGTVVAFVGKPHLMNSRSSQVRKALTNIGWEHYYAAEETGWVLYLEGASDLEILRSFAAILKHEKALEKLSRPFVYYVSTNQPQKCRDHYQGLREAKPDLLGIAIFDKIDNPLTEDGPLVEMMWKRREIENYFCTEEVLLKYARHEQMEDDIFGSAEADRREQAMKEAIREIVQALEILDEVNRKPWSSEIKASDDFLDLVFKKYFAKLKLPLLLQKKDYYQLAKLLEATQLDQEISEKLNAIVAIAEKASPVGINDQSQ